MMQTDDEVIEAACVSVLGDLGGGVASLVRGLHASPRRAYHNIAHIAAMLRLVRHWVDTPSPTLLAAVLYHDIVYNPQRSDNEEQSAQLCHHAVSKRRPVADADEAARLVLLTKKHDPAPDDRDGVLLVCADLWVLGGTPDEYAAYTRAVRHEYAHVPDEAWQVGRARVMRGFLEQERIYPASPFAPPGTDAREASARRNVQNEIDALSSPVFHA